MMVDFWRTQFALFPLTILKNTVDHPRLLGTTLSRDLRWSSHTHRSEKGPAETVLTVATQEVQPTIGAAGYLLHSHYSVCPVLIHHCVALSSQDLYRATVRKRAATVCVVLSHHEQKQFRLLPSGQGYRALSAKISRLSDEHLAVRMIFTRFLLYICTGF